MDSGQIIFPRFLRIEISAYTNPATNPVKPAPVQPKEAPVLAAAKAIIRSTFRLQL